MTLDPTNAWVVIKNGNVSYVRLTNSMAEACANIEKEVYPNDDIKIVPVLMTEIEDVK